MHVQVKEQSLVTFAVKGLNFIKIKMVHKLTRSPVFKLGFISQ